MTKSVARARDERRKPEEGHESCFARRRRSHPRRSVGAAVAAAGVVSGADRERDRRLCASGCGSALGVEAGGGKAPPNAVKRCRHETIDGSQEVLRGDWLIRGMVSETGAGDASPVVSGGGETSGEDLPDTASGPAVSGSDPGAGDGVSGAGPQLFEAFPLLKLPVEVLVMVMSRLDSVTLVQLELTSRAFRARHPVGRLRLSEVAARDALFRLVRRRLDGGWRFPSWKMRLFWEESGTGFNYDLGQDEGFAFVPDRSTWLLKEIKLNGLGPKMLVSDASTSEQPALRWKLRVQGNTAVEFGAVPTNLQGRRKALHKCLTETSNMLSVGFCSQITVGSQLPFRVPVVKGTIIELLVHPGKAHFTVTNPTDGLDTRWENNHRVHTEYRGPGEIKFAQDFDNSYDVKLALTAWAKASFDVLHVCGASQLASQTVSVEEGDIQDTEMLSC